ncbi:MAG: hypothetical protein HYX52_06740 [Chloroflexi bacterium]|nr:hypothetical protein [Chloroflexota bacterium]
MTTQNKSHTHVEKAPRHTGHDESATPGEAYMADLEPTTTNEPDEPGEGALTRTSPSGGFEVRVTPDHGEAPIGEQMERTAEEAERSAAHRSKER